VIEHFSQRRFAGGSPVMTADVPADVPSQFPATQAAGPKVPIEPTDLNTNRSARISGGPFTI
jgi:hypothetical protein